MTTTDLTPDEVNKTDRPYRDDVLITDLVDRAADRRGDAPAVVGNDNTMSHRDVADLSNRVARTLAESGVGPGGFVGLLSDHVVEAVPSLLGIMKSGAAYVPFDHRWPDSRIASLIDELAIEVLVVSRDRLGRALSLADRSTSLTVLMVPDLPAAPLRAPSPDGAGPALTLIGRAELDQRQSTPLPVSVTPSDLAYVIFTSGSTGRPKGVAVEHRSVVNLIDWVNREHAVVESDRLLFVTSFAFDLSVYDMFGILAAGASIRMLPDEVLRLPERVRAVIDQEPITFWDSAPQALAAVLGTPSPDAGSASLRLVFLSGDWVPLATVEDLWAQYPGAGLVALGGATEATVWSNHHRVDALLDGWSSVPYGIPMQNVRYHVLDNRLDPVPVGRAGDLYIAGDCLARGYLDNPAATASQFVPDPFSPIGGSRMYATGDLARWSADGLLEFLGRADDQVKVRGHRMELGEIRSALLQLPGVQDAAVVVDPETENAIVAFTVCSQGPDVHAGWEDGLRTRLPTYAMPSACYDMASFPMTANGKVDRSQLLAAHRMKEAALTQWFPAGAFEPHAQSRTPMETLVAKAWAEVLEVDEPPLDAGFFNLGGTSFGLTRVAELIHESTGVNLDTAVLYDYLTIDELARYLDDTAEQPGSGSDIASHADNLRKNGETFQVPASLAQTQLWLADTLQDVTGAYNVAGAMEIDGPLDVDALRQATDLLVERHEGLRTTFEQQERLLVQVVHQRIDVPFRVIDLEQFPPQQRETAALDHVLDAARQQFDVAAGPLFCLDVLQMDSNSHVVVLNLHHLITDGRSLDVLMDELLEAYTGYQQGRVPELPPVPVQYADFTTWQHEQVTPEVLETELDYWRSELVEAPTYVELPTDVLPGAQRSGRGTTVAVRLPADLVAQLRDYSNSQGCTLYMALMASLLGALHRHSGQQDMVIGSVAANRQRSELNRVIGFLVNTLALRFDLSGDPRLDELLQRVRATSLGALAHQSAPFAMVGEAVLGERRTGRGMFNVMFAYREIPAKAQVTGLTATPLDLEAGVSRYDLTLLGSESGGEVKLELEFSTDLFTVDAAERLLGHIVSMARHLANDPTARLSEPTILSDDEVALLESWSAPTSSIGAPTDTTLHGLVETQAKLHPDAVAVRHEETTLTYANLVQQASAVAEQLAHDGIGRGDLVAVHEERGWALVVAVLGIMQSGAAYLPLDPASPAARLDQILADGGVSAVVTRSRFGEDRLPTWVRRIAIADPNGEPPKTTGPRPALSPRDLAYVIYTSGSTGTPKGVQVEHRNIVPLLEWARAEMPMDVGDIWLQTVAPSFDVSLIDLFVPLMQGATVVPVPNEIVLDPEAMVDLIDENQPTRMCLTPSHVQLLTAPERSLSGLQLLVIGGEALSTDLARRCVELAGDECVIWNVYGPTECTVVQTASRVDHRRLELDSPCGVVSIGKPVADARCRVLDSAGHLQAIGAVGELVIDGSCVSRGYLGRPSATAEQFVPGGGEPTGRAYRTGDLVRWLEDGTIRYLGRGDRQVKLGGMRIELGEIEAVLRSIPEVDDAVVLLDQHHTRDRLVGNVMVSGEKPPTGTAIRSALASKLPRYMVPARLLVVDRFPLTPSGKVDSNALLQLEAVELASEVEEARSSAEQLLARHWGSTLGLDRVDIHTDLFVLGGSSLDAVHLAGVIGRELDLDVRPTTVLAYPTIASLANELELLRWQSGSPTNVGADDGEREVGEL